MDQTCRQEGERFQNTEVCSMVYGFGIMLKLCQREHVFVVDLLDI